jgi:hypothetical protein
VTPSLVPTSICDANIIANRCQFGPRYLVIVVLLSLNGSFIAAALVSGVAVVFLQDLAQMPLVSLSLDEPLDGVALSTFLTLTTALVITRLVSKMRISLGRLQMSLEDLRRAEEASRQQAVLPVSGCRIADAVAHRSRVIQTQPYFDAPAQKSGRHEGIARKRIFQRLRAKWVLDVGIADSSCLSRDRCLRVCHCLDQLREVVKGRKLRGGSLLRERRLLP